MKLNINPFNTNNPLTFRDAAVIATVTALVIWILNFLATATIEGIRADLEAFVFEAIKSYLVSWAGTFITLAGLEQLVKRIEKKQKK